MTYCNTIEFTFKVVYVTYCNTIEFTFKVVWLPGSVKIASQKIVTQKIATYENCPLWKYPPMRVPPSENFPSENRPVENCLKEKYPQKINPPPKLPHMKAATIVVRNWKLLPCSAGHGFRGSTDTYLIWYG